jgi:hypothetical protein
MSQANKELSRRFTDLFSTGDLARAEEFMSSDVAVHGTSADGEVRGLDQMLEFVAAYRRAFPDAHESSCTPLARPRPWPRTTATT